MHAPRLRCTTASRSRFAPAPSGVCFASGAFALAAALAAAPAADPPSKPDLPAPNSPEAKVKVFLLERKKSALQDRQREMEKRVRQSDAVAALRRAVDAAKAEQDRLRRGSGALFKARATEMAASQELDRLVAACVESSGESARLDEKRRQLAQQWNEAKFQADRAAIRLRFETQKVQPDVDEDPEVKRLGQAVSAIEADRRDNPMAAVASARAALTPVASAFASLDQRLNSDPRLQALAAAERAARQVLADAEKNEPGRELVSNARQEYEKARQDALAKIPDAAPFLQEARAAGAAKQAVDLARRGLKAILEVHREAVRSGHAPAAVSARAALVNATGNYDRCTASNASLSNLTARAGAAREAWTRSRGQTLAQSADYAALAASIGEKELRAKEMESAAARVAAPDALKDAARAIGELRTDLDALLARQRDLALRLERSVPGDVQEARASADRLLRDAIGAAPAAAEARRAVEAAEQALRRAVESTLAEGTESAAALRALRDLDRDGLDLDCRLAIVRHNTDSEHSSLRATVDADETVGRRRLALETLDVQTRENPSPGMTLARDTQAKAHRVYTAAIEKARTGAYDEALAARNRAEADLRQAERDDPRNQTVEEARTALRQRRNDVLAAFPAVRAAQEEHRKLQAALDAVQARKHDLLSEGIERNRTIREGPDPAIAAARAKLEEARQARKNIEESDAVVSAAQNLEKAQQAFDARVAQCLEADADYRAAARQIADIDAQIAALGTGRGTR
jgi:hypothetical protein